MHHRLTAGLSTVLLVLLAACTTPMRPSSSGAPVSVPPNATATLTLTGAEEVPPVTTSALATGAFEVRPDGSMSGSIATTGIIATAAHIHDGANGTNGPVVMPLTSTADNVWSLPPNAMLTSAQYESYRAGNLYVNVHSSAHPDGEIRSQLWPR